MFPSWFQTDYTYAFEGTNCAQFLVQYSNDFKNSQLRRVLALSIIFCRISTPLCWRQPDSFWQPPTHFSYMTSSDLATGLGRNTSMCAATPVGLPCPVGWSQGPSSRDTSADRHFTSAVQSPGYSNNLTRCVPTAHPYYSCTMCTLYILGLHGHFNEFLHWPWGLQIFEILSEWLDCYLCWEEKRRNGVHCLVI